MIYTITKNEPLFQACKNIITDKGLECAKYAKYIKVEDGKFIASNGRCLMASSIDGIPDGFYKPVSVSKKEVVLSLSSEDEVSFPNTEMILSSTFKFRASVKKYAISEMCSPSVLSVISSIPISDEDCKIAKSLKLDSFFWKDSNSPMMFKDELTSLYTMPLICKGVYVEEL